MNYLSSIPRKGKIHIEVSYSLCLTTILSQEQDNYITIRFNCQYYLQKNFKFLYLMIIQHLKKFKKDEVPLHLMVLGIKNW